MINMINSQSHNQDSAG